MIILQSIEQVTYKKRSEIVGKIWNEFNLNYPVWHSIWLSNYKALYQNAIDKKYNKSIIYNKP